MRPFPSPKNHIMRGPGVRIHKFLLFPSFSIYSTCKIITRSFYILYPLFEVQKHLLKVFFLKTLALCTVSNHIRVIMARYGITGYGVSRTGIQN